MLCFEDETCWWTENEDNGKKCHDAMYNEWRDGHLVEQSGNNTEVYLNLQFFAVFKKFDVFLKHKKLGLINLTSELSYLWSKIVFLYISWMK